VVTLLEEIEGSQENGHGSVKRISISTGAHLPVKKDDLSKTTLHAKTKPLLQCALNLLIKGTVVWPKKQLACVPQTSGNFVRSSNKLKHGGWNFLFCRSWAAIETMAWSH